MLGFSSFDFYYNKNKRAHNLVATLSLPLAPQPIPIRITKALDVTIWIARHQATSLAPSLAG